MPNDTVLMLLSWPWRLCSDTQQILVWPLTSLLQTDEVFLEAQIQNITTSPMFMEKVSLEPSMMYNVTELNAVKSGEEE